MRRREGAALELTVVGLVCSFKDGPLTHLSMIAPPASGTMWTVQVLVGLDIHDFVVHGAESETTARLTVFLHLEGEDIRSMVVRKLTDEQATSLRAAMETRVSIG